MVIDFGNDAQIRTDSENSSWTCVGLLLTVSGNSVNMLYLPEKKNNSLVKLHKKNYWLC